MYNHSLIPRTIPSFSTLLCNIEKLGMGLGMNIGMGLGTNIEKLGMGLGTNIRMGLGTNIEKLGMGLGTNIEKLEWVWGRSYTIIPLNSREKLVPRIVR